MCGWQIKLCDSVVHTLAISKRLRDELLIYKALYKFICLLRFTLHTSRWWWHTECRVVRFQPRCNYLSVSQPFNMHAMQQHPVCSDAVHAAGSQEQVHDRTRWPSRYAASQQFQNYCKKARQPQSNSLMCLWWSGVVVSTFLRSTKLIYVGPG